MRKKTLTLLLSGIIIISFSIGIYYANEKVNIFTRTYTSFKAKYRQNVLKRNIARMMGESSYRDLVKAFEKGDYKTIDNFINNLSDEDYSKIIDIMRNSGYESMARMMESISKEKIIQIHNAMGGAVSCHKNYSNYSGS